MNRICEVLHKRIFKNNHETIGFEREREYLLQKINQICIDQDSSSVLIMGKSGSGKTQLVNSILREIESRDDFRKIARVHLDGIKQSDDKMALKCIGRQLKINLKDDDSEEITNESFNDTFKFILSVLSNGNQNSIPILVILENFDLFLDHKNQMLIYNLLNATQISGTAICVIGLTCRLDVIELMEKRVKSRFSHNRIELESFVNSIQRHRDVVKQFLTIPGASKQTSNWNKHISQFLNEPDVRALLEKAYFLSNSICDLKKLLKYLVQQLSTDNSTLKLQHLQNAWQNINCDYNSSVLLDLGELEFTILIIMVRFNKAVNFVKIYKEYQSFCVAYSMRPQSRTVMRKCTDSLLDLQLATPCPTAGSFRVGACGPLMYGFQDLTVLVSQHQVTEAIKHRAHVDSRLVNYLASEQVS